MTNGAPVWAVARPGAGLVRVEGVFGGDTTPAAARVLAGLESNAGCAERRCWIDVEAPTSAAPEALDRVARDLRGPRPRGSAPTADAAAAALVRLFRTEWPAPKDRESSAWARLRHGLIGVLVGGEVTLESALALAERGFGALDHRRATTAEPHGTPKLHRALVHTPNAQRVDIVLAWAEPPCTSPTWPAYVLATEVIAGSYRSRLAHALREEAGVTYGVTLEREESPSGGLTRVDFTVAMEDAPEALAAVARVLGGNAPTADELDRARKAIWMAAVVERETLAGTLWSLGRDLADGGTPGDGWRRLAGLVDVSVDSVERETWRWRENRVELLIGDRNELEPLLEAAHVDVEGIFSQ